MDTEPTGDADARDRTDLRFLFSLIGGYGHFHPLVPLAHALQQAGHSVAFAAGVSLAPLVEAAGFHAFAFEGSLAADPEYQAFQAARRTMPLSLASELVIYTHLFCGISTRVRTPQLVALAKNWQPDMLIREAGEYGAAIAAEHLGLPHATVSFAASLRGLAVFERDATTQLDPIRRSWGLPPDPELHALYRYLLLAYSPPRFALHEVGALDALDDARPIPATTQFVRPQIYDQASREGLPEGVAELPDQPTIYLTLGTEANREPGIYPDVLATMIAGLRELPINLIVTLGREHDPADFGPQPPNVHIERYIPQSLLLPHCDLLVMHGGSNSLLAALDLGLPTVVVPLIADQFFNAHVIDALRLGRIVPREQLTPQHIRAAVEDALATPVYRQNAARLRAEMQALPNQNTAVRLVEQIARHGAPSRP